MVVILLIGLVFVGITCVLLVRTLLFTRLRAAETVREIDLYGFEGMQQAEARRQRTGRQTNFRAGVDSLAHRFGAALAGSPRLSPESLRRELRAAGFYGTPTQRFVGYQVLSTVIIAIFWMWAARAGHRPAAIQVLGTIAALWGGWMLPRIYVRRRGRLRGERIDYEMPDLIDALVATVEAGVGFASALQLATRRFRGPLGEELRLTLQEQSMGLALNDALGNMLERQPTPTVRAFVRALVQGEQLGVSIGQTLRNLAHDMRVLRRRLAEERAQKAPVKMVFPLILCFFPALLIIVIGPAVLHLSHIFK